MNKAFSCGVSMAFLLWSGAAFAQSAERGERAFNQQCKSCHSVEKGGAQPIGPNLFGVVGRKAGTAEGYAASDAMKKSGITWGETTLAEYLKNPAEKVPAGKMAFAGLKQANALADVIAYLKKQAP